MQIFLHITVGAFVSLNAAINNSIRILANCICCISFEAVRSRSSHNFHKKDSASDVSLVFSKTFSNMHRQSKVSSLVIFFSRYQPATLYMLQNELVTVQRRIQKLWHIEKRSLLDSSGKEENENLEKVHFCFKPLFLDVARFLGLLFESQSQEITQSGDLHAAIVYVIARLSRQCQAPQCAQTFLLAKSAVRYLCHLKLNNIIDRRKTTSKKTLLSMIDFA